MTTKARKWGNSIAIRVPSEIARKHGIENGTNLEIRDKENGFFVEPLEEEPSLEDMLKQITDENRHDYIEFGRKGRELI